jgi:tRNA pseudouridine32 synthase / 23S rRNA pseudouridine746 synthase
MYATMTPEQMVSRLLYRDGLMLVIDKPAGLAVHRGPNGGTSLEDDFDALRFGLPRAPALAHRLDRDTSGCLVLGRHRKALAQLGKLFKNGAIDKTYWAVVEGAPDTDEGLIDLPLGRLDATRGWWMKYDPGGQPAVTKWKVMGRSSFTSPWRGEVDLPKADRVGVNGGVAPPHPAGSAGDPPPPGEGNALTWLALEPVTGRTHQLRVHCAEMGWPILGDTIYGNAPRSGGPGLHLHARKIVVPLYKNRAPIRVTAPVPPHMRAVLSRCGWQQEESQLPSSFRGPNEVREPGIHNPGQ